MKAQISALAVCGLLAPSVFGQKAVGWKVKELASAPDRATTPMLEYRKVYDTTKTGRGNGGHTYGDKLTEEQRTALIEYLKTL